MIVLIYLYLYLMIKKILNNNKNKIKETIGLIKKKLKYPIENKSMFIKDKNKLV